mgnify:CR=1 FL=1
MKKMLFIPALFLSFCVFAQKNITVAQDGSGDYKTIQAAFDAIPPGNKSRVEVDVKPGVYTERAVLDSTKQFVTVVGAGADRTILSYNNHSGMTDASGRRITTPTSASLFINASNFTARDITFRNDAGFSAGQAVAVYAYGDKLAFRHCNFIGFQDVLFCSGLGSRQYYQDCYIEGTTDFIFGPATCVFKNCRIKSKKNSHVTAASTPEGVKYGFVFLNCRLTGDTSLHSVSLGRPWRPYACVTYIRCYLGGHIKPEGWANWNQTESYKTARYAEYKDYGPGANPHTRVNWARQLTDTEAKTYTIKNILSGADDWNPLKQLK